MLSWGWTVGGWGEQKGLQLGRLATDSSSSDGVEAGGTRCGSSDSQGIKKGRGTWAHNG